MNPTNNPALINGIRYALNIYGNDLATSIYSNPGFLAYNLKHRDYKNQK